MPKHVPPKSTSTRGYNASNPMSQSAKKKGYDVPYDSPKSSAKRSNKSKTANQTPKPTSKQDHNNPSSSPGPTPKLKPHSKSRKHIPKVDNQKGTPEGAYAKPSKERRQRNYIAKVKRERRKHRELLVRVLKAGENYGVQDAGLSPERVQYFNVLFDTKTKISEVTKERRIDYQNRRDAIWELREALKYVAINGLRQPLDAQADEEDSEKTGAVSKEACEHDEAGDTEDDVIRSALNDDPILSELAKDLARQLGFKDGDAEMDMTEQ